MQTSHGDEPLHSLSRLLGFREEDGETLRRHQDKLLLGREVLGKEFYWYLLKNPETSSLLPAMSGEGLDRLISQQMDYFEGVVSQPLSASQAEKVIALGQMHHRIGVSMVWVAGAYERYLSHMLSRLNDAHYPDEVRRPLTRAIRKRILLDMLLQLQGFQQSISAETQLQHRHMLDMSRMYATLSGVSLALIHSRSRDELFHAICSTCVEKGGATYAGISWIDTATNHLEYKVFAGPESTDFIHQLSRALSLDPSNPYSRGPTGQAVLTMTPQVVNCCEAEPMMAPWRALFEREGIKSLLAVPLFMEGKVVGTLTLHSRLADFFDLDKVALVQTMASEIGHALERLDALDRSSRAEARIRYLSDHDPLTGLPNRQNMQALIQGRIEQGAGSEAVVVIALAIDSFHQINARLGHEGGDLVLCEAARRIEQCLGDTGRVGRVGAARFVITSGYNDRLENLLDRLLQVMREPAECLGQWVDVRSSCGVVVSHADSDAATLLRRAEVALARAKESGGNQYRHYDQRMDEEIHRIHSLRAAFAEALANNALELFYQPKIDLRSEVLQGVEALVRWKRQDQFVSPGEFFPAIEHTDLMRELDWWVLRQSLKQITDWKARGHVIKVSVNLSAMTLKQEGFLPGIELLLASYPDAAGLLELEVLESVSQKEAEQVVHKLERCRRLGISIALDDFGTGASSLVHLQQLPFDTIKMDQSFVRVLLEAPGNEAIIHSMVAFARYTGRKLVVEGVESKAIWLRLLELGCTVGQGYAISRPVPAEVLIEWALQQQAGANINISYTA
ncbi:EAL domain-containing protein [Pseudogulbenkiania ferrooxidans]|uniref:Diguanylate cyclase DosC n=1 Tax=Pseudogulbenkiania ferrooxidans 2002 TaxID=279714 RepID=B9Z3Y4_9NEIS|nr:EAL domain-containing protein [Pseudogulbenkiania ferrooxidans]EEG08561.1 diguanylate cyclase/phosphodiesterase with GAF sensor [Pseudogulbenkiania ferrooxidans 2002]